MPDNKKLAQESSLRAYKISQTFKRKHLDNFKIWRDSMRVIGKIPSSYPKLTHSVEFAELIGVILGDGNISKFPRTERLILVANANYPEMIQHWVDLVVTVFGKSPVTSRIRGTNAVRISLYQKFISKRTHIPTGNRTFFEFQMPRWILNNNKYLISYLKGAFEAEGSLNLHLPTGTYNFAFRNNNRYLLDSVQQALFKLGYNPEVRDYAIRLRKKNEVESFRKLISFKEYLAG